jgi:UDP-N-acetylmuramoyl-tripeptide--D-alanyl-D-alanine ligase
MSAQFSFEQAAQATGGQWLQAPPHGVISGVQTDTRQLTPGALFIALRGANFDGHDFLHQARELGAVGAVVDNSDNAPADLPLLQVGDTLQALGALAKAHRAKFAIPVIGVTGSYGKTTTRALIATALSSQLKTLASEGNFNNEIGVPLTLLQLDETHQAAVIEMAMRGAGQIEYLADIARPTHAVITNIGPQHIELLGSEENIARAKAEILKFLPPDGVAILPADDEYLDFFTDQVGCHAVRFGFNPSAEYHGAEVKTESDGTISFAITTDSHLKTHSVHLPFPGVHNVANALAALAVADLLDVPLDRAAKALESAQVPGARMRVFQSGGLTIIDDSYNAGPTSMRAALQTLLDFPGAGRRVAILGSMKELGEFSEAEHRKIGDFAGSLCDVLIGVGGETRPLLNAAVESARQIENELQTFYCDNAQEAASRLNEWTQDGDVILVKGSRSVSLETVVTALGG